MPVGLTGVHWPQRALLVMALLGATLTLITAVVVAGREREQRDIFSGPCLQTRAMLNTERCLPEDDGHPLPWTVLAAVAGVVVVASAGGLLRASVHRDKA